MFLRSVFGEHKMCPGEDQSSVHLVGLAVDVANTVMSLADVGTAFKTTVPWRLSPSSFLQKKIAVICSYLAALGFYLAAS